MFDEIINRRGSNSIKWQVQPGELPMWIADMDFATAPAVVAAMKAKVNSGVFGYEEVPAAYFTAFADWYEQRDHQRPDPAWMSFASGVMPAIGAMIRQLTQPGDQIVVQAPVYNMFFSTIAVNGRTAASADLSYNLQTARYAIDFDRLESVLAQPASTLMLLCNPHNPIGKAWSKADLTQIATLCVKHHVRLIADEIHGDLVFGEPAYTPVFSLPDELRANSIVCVSPSKTFNLAGIHAATVMVPDAALHAQVDRALATAQVAEPNALATTATIAAYTQGGQWLDALKAQLTTNRQTLATCLATQLPSVRLASENATYLAWLDISQVSADSAAFCQWLRAETGLILAAGDAYHGNGAHFLRLNLACPPQMLDDGLQRLVAGVTKYPHAS
ncbi:MAG: PatB family C-S lyase [Lactobacillus sp.]|jgi:cystathionine beta-lyase|nr:PatB family C-S lyase [Lactobacillus sp.]MCI1941438.1 PatB family C-S lyase [Lactobacillus sp.]MCI1972051.1 PatB family C-S lyase [Lactobacillus sp.]MCI2016106.1 PatB family C-S lyase [Lactobacillus sp.]MCI2036461.1 PatB family C-S lyase [Lactobacillus sp.]